MTEERASYVTGNECPYAHLHGAGPCPYCAMGLKAGDFFWNPKREIFEWHGVLFHVHMAKIYLAHHPDTPVGMIDAGPLGVMTAFVDIRPELAQRANPLIPIVVVDVSNSYIIVDGWHRVSRVLSDGVAAIPAVIVDYPVAISFVERLAQAARKDLIG